MFKASLFRIRSYSNSFLVSDENLKRNQADNFKSLPFVTELKYFLNSFLVRKCKDEILYSQSLTVVGPFGLKVTFFSPSGISVLRTLSNNFAQTIFLVSSAFDRYVSFSMIKCYLLFLYEGGGGGGRTPKRF